MKTMLSAAAAFGLLLAASASNPAAAAGTYQSSAAKAAAAVAVTPGAKDLGGIISVDDDAEYYARYEGNQSNNRYNQWPYPQPDYYGVPPRNYQGDSDPSWRDRNWNNNPWWNPYQGSHYGNRKPLPDKLIVHRLRQQHFYNVTKIKEKKGYYKVYAFDAYRRPVSVIVDPYTGRVLRVGPR